MLASSQHVILSIKPKGFTWMTQAVGFMGVSSGRSASRVTDKNAWPWKRPKSGEVDYLAGLGGYPLNMDAGEHFMRPRTGIDYFPFPPRIGAMSSFMPQLDVLVWHGMYRRPPTGPNLPAQLGPAGLAVARNNLQWQLSVPGLTKTA